MPYDCLMIVLIRLLIVHFVVMDFCSFITGFVRLGQGGLVCSRRGARGGLVESGGG